MKIIVCVKQVPDTTDVKIDKEKGVLIREGIPSIINPFDQFAVEEGVRLKETYGGEVIVISMGPSQARSVIMKSLALGADKGILLSDEVFRGADTLATSYTLSLAIKKFSPFHLVLCGQQAIDGDTAQVGPELASHLGIAQITYVDKIEIEGEKIVVRRQIEEGYEILESNLPLLLTLTPSPDFIPGNPPFSKIIKAKSKPYLVWGEKELEGDSNKFGLKGSPTQVRKVYTPPKREKGEMLKGNLNEVVDALVKRLTNEGIL
jgi:electron transfer flavoprotein beta subunit